MRKGNFILLFLLIFTSSISIIYADNYHIVWTNTYNPGNNDRSCDIAVDSAENVYVTGVMDNGSDNDYFTIKYSNSGAICWSKQYDGGDNDFANSIAVDGNGNVYVTGEKGIGGGNSAYFTIKYDNNGNLIWTNQHASSGSDGATGIAIDNSGNVFVTGYKDNLTGDYFTIKYDSNGNIIWTNQYDGGSWDSATAIAVDNISGNIYVTGIRLSGFDFDYCTIKINSGGWWTGFKGYGGANYDWPRDIAVDNGGNIYVTGVQNWGMGDDYLTIKYASGLGAIVWTRVFDSGDDDAGNGIAVDSGSNVFVTGESFVATWNYLSLKYQEDGTPVWTNEYDSGNWDKPSGIKVDDNGNIYVTGEKSGDFFTIKYAPTPPFPPTIPGWIEITGVTTNQIDVVWENVLNETSYTLFRNTVNDSMTATNIGWTSENQTNYNDIGLLANTKYYYWVKACNAAGTSNFSVVVSNSTLPPPPSVPTGLMAAALSTNKIELTWNDVSNETSYTLFKSLANNPITATNVAGLIMDNTIYTNSDLLPNTKYFYWVEAYNAGGSSGFSAVASNSTLLPPPAVPTGLAAVALSTNEIELIWNDVSNETSYTLFRNLINDPGTATNVAGLSMNENIYTNSDLLPNTKYYYWVKAYNAGGSSGFSAVVSNSTLLPPPTVPTGLMAVALSTNKIELTWNDVSNETSYTLFRNLINDPVTATNVVGLLMNENIYTNSGLLPNTKYYYWVKAYNAGGSSGFSAVVSNSTLFPPPSVPTGLAAVALATNTIALVWNDIPNETSYTLFRNLINDPGSATNIAGFSMNESIYTNVGLSTNTKYYYWVKAYNAGGSSGFSAVASDTTLALGDFNSGISFGRGLFDSSIEFGDIDNDGHLDLIVTGSDMINDYLDKYINDGTGNFSGPLNFGTGVQESSISMADLDNDGDLDLIVTGQEGANERLDKYINDGSGNFAGPVSFGVGVEYSSICIGDLDNDGDLDLIVTGSDGANERLDKYINDGSGNFAGPASFGVGVEYSSISMGDLDNDGDLDLIATGDNGANERLDKYMNDGTGNFAGPVSFGTGVVGSSIVLGDLDSDGDLDLITSGWSGNSRLDKYMNDGQGNFTGPTSLGTGLFDTSIALGDLNSDGDLDLIASGLDNGASQRLHKYINDGSGNFAGPESFDTHIAYSSIALGDLNSDGNLDLVISGATFTFVINKYMNIGGIINDPPSVPMGMASENVNGKWRLKWDKSTDDHTDQNMLRYQIAIGTNTGQYKYCSTNIDYPRGQANLGKVTIVTGTPYYQTGITNTKAAYWKVCAIDSAFIHSAYCSEQDSTIPTPPLTPIGLVANAISYSKIDLSWNDISNETSYTLFRNIVNDSNTATNIVGLGLNQAAFIDSGLSTNTKYYYWVRAYNSVGLSGFSDVASNTTFPMPPSIPNIIAIQAISTNQIDLMWNDSSNETSYTLFRHIVDNSNTAFAIAGFSANQTNYSDTGLVPNTSYYYWIKACKGPSKSGFSAVASTVLLPTRPQIDNILAIGTNQINLTWRNINNETGYTLYRSLINDTNTVSNIAGFLADQTNYSDISLITNSLYYYWVKVYNASGISAFSSPASNITYPSIPAIPSISIIHAVYTNQIDLGWNDISNETSYTLFRNIVNNSNTAAVIAGFSANQTNYPDAGLVANTLYYYWVKAYRGKSKSGFSLVVSMVPLPAAPQIDNILAVSSDQIDLTWRNIDNETSYTLYRNMINDTNTVSNIAGFAVNQTNYSDTGLAGGTLYCYWIKVVNVHGMSRFSGAASNTTSPSGPPSAPSFVNTAVISTNEIQVSWENVPSETSYTLYRNTLNDPNTALKVTGTAANIVNFSDVSLNPGNKYYFWVKAYNSLGESSFSTVGSNTTLGRTVAVILFGDDFSTDKGWTGYGGTANWERGSATAGGGVAHGYPDPGTDHSASGDNNILGTTIGGDYAANIFPTDWIVSPVIDCSGATAVSLSFWKYLGLESNVYDHGYIEAFNGTIWVNIWSNGWISIEDNSWNQLNIDVSTWADNNPNFQIRFGLGATDFMWEFCGWNIDDILISALGPAPPLEIPLWITAECLSYDQIELIWKNILNEDGYTVYRNTINDSSSAIVVGGKSANLTSFIDKGLSPETTYYYWVKSYNQNGQSGFSPFATATTVAGTKIPDEDAAIYHNSLNVVQNEIAKIVFGKKGTATIKIYTFRGVLIKEFAEMNYMPGDFVEWDGYYMESDNKVASGIYIVIIQGDIEMKMKMIVIN